MVGRNCPSSVARLVAAGCALLATAAPPAAGVSRAEVVNRILATVDGEPITMHEVRKFVVLRAGGRIPEGAAFDLSLALEAYITEKVIQREVSDKGIVVRDEDIDRYIENVRAQNDLSPERLREAIEAQGLTWETYRKQVRQELEKAQLVTREIRGKVNVTPEEVERYYEAHKAEYATPAQYRVRHLLLRLPPEATPEDAARLEDRARDLRRRIVRGGDFAQVAREHSEDPAASDGGDLGFVAPGEMLDELSEVVTKLRVGEVSEPIRSAAGVHLVRVEEKKDASHTPVGELAAEIKERLYSAALEERYERWLTEDLRRRHHIEVRP